MGIALTESNRPHTGEYHYRKVLELTRGRNPMTLANLAWNLKNQGRIDESRALYEEAVAAEPSLHALLGWARMEEADRNLDRALELLDRAEQIAPDNPSILLLRAMVYGRKRDHRRALALLNRLAEKSGAEGLGANELLEKGRLLDQPDARLPVCVRAGNRGVALSTGDGAGRTLSLGADDALPADPLRGHRRRPSSERPPDARIYRRTV
jgi:tetratricopeptide (TPR) repeat protein